MSLRPRTALGGAVAGVGLMVLTWLAAFHVAIVIRADHAVLAGFAGLSRPRLDTAIEFIAHLCNPQPYVYLAAIPIVVAFVRGRPRVAVMLGAVMLGANLSSQVLKPLLAAPRGAPGVAAASWPSGHATAAMTLVLCAVIAAPARRRPAVAAVMSAFAVAVCYSFLTLRWHFPSDVLGGFELAAVWALLGVAALGWVQQRHPVARTFELPRRAHVSVAEALAPIAMLILLALVAAAIVALARPRPVVDYAAAHKLFLLGAAVIAALGVSLAAAATVALRRS